MAKRITSSSVNWSLIMEMLPPQVSSRVVPLKTASDKCLRDLASQPAELPKIDWSSYKSRITVPGMVDSYMKAYEGLKIPYPTDQGALAEAEKLNTELLKTAEKNIKDIEEDIKKLKEHLKHLESLMKPSDMTIEEMFLARPELRMDSNNIRLFPHYIADPPGKVKEDH